ncbi:MAG: transcriptional initiation protein Tat [Methylohalobius sp.]|nr:transcriptional initiation protein Tat [Methylohalobius sp.]
MERREFLRCLGSLVAIGAAVALPKPEPVRAAELDPKPAKGYRETEHIRRYYQTARLG